MRMCDRNTEVVVKPKEREAAGKGTEVFYHLEEDADA